MSPSTGGVPARRNDDDDGRDDGVMMMMYRRSEVHLCIVDGGILRLPLLGGGRLDLLDGLPLLVGEAMRRVLHSIDVLRQL